MMFKEVVQSVIQYRSETWGLTDTMVTFLEGFHHRITGHIAGMTEHRGNGREWDLA